MNIIIPIGGLGSRFKKDGYRFSKPLINIIGRPMILWVVDNLNISEEDTVWIAHNDYLEQNIGQLLSKEYPKLDFRTIILKSQTRGAAETLYAVVQRFPESILDKPVISLDCDSIYFDDVLGKFRNTDDCGACFYFLDQGTKPLFSYIKMSDGIITEVKEKVKISGNANTGAYGFPSGRLLRDHCSVVLDNGVGVGGEFYTSNVVSAMIREGVPFKGIRVDEDDFACVGTPAQLQCFLHSLKKRNRGMERKMRFCFDLDNTLVTFPITHGNYLTCRPRKENIEILKGLHKAGHTIIIQTARRMRTHNGNVGKIMADIGKLTFDQLDNFGIPYDEIYFGKPQADVYVDDLAVNSLVDTAKEIGWSSELKKTTHGMVSPREFNQVVKLDNVLVKTTHTPAGLGESFYFKNIPTTIQHLFPKLISVEDLPNNATSIHMEYINSISMAQLSCMCCVTEGRLSGLLDSLNEIHTCNESELPSLHVCVDNYCHKMSQRYNIHKDTYRDADELYNTIFHYLKEYECSTRVSIVPCIHGDPVFSNALLTPDGKFKFVDMRGMQGDSLTLGGDIVYDLSKVYQSVLGYDFILLNSVVPTDQEERYLKELQSSFFVKIKELYPGVSPVDILTVTASHLFTLIPLHTDKSMQEWALIKARDTIRIVKELSNMRAII